MKSTHVVTLCVLLVQFLLWTSALLTLPYSASSTLALKVVLWGIPATSAGLDLLMEIVSERVVAESRYVEDRTFVSKTVPKGETLLFVTDDGIDFVLKSGTRKTDKRSDAGEGAAPRPEPQT